MAGARGAVVECIRRLASSGDVGGPRDQELLGRYVQVRDKTAFGVLLRRHAPMVWNAARRIVTQAADADDVLQAAFLLLARDAKSLLKHPSLAGWLHEAACRLAKRARTTAVRRSRRESQAPPRPPADALADITVRELLGLLDETLQRLPQKYRTPLVLCYLEGRTQDESARQMGCSLSTFKRRLERGRELLRSRLVRLGVTFPAAFLTTALTEKGMAAVPASVVAATVQAAMELAMGNALPSTISASVVALIKGAGSWLSAGKLKLCAVLLAGFCAMGGVARVWTMRAAVTQPEVRQAQEREDEVRIDESKKPRKPGTDLYGDALPPDAVARLGTIRFNHGDGLSSLHYSPDGKTIVSYGGGMVRLWDADTGLQKKHFSTVWRGATFSQDQTALLQDGKTLVSLQQSGRTTLHFYDLNEGKETRVIDLDPKFSLFRPASLSPTGQYAALPFPDAVYVFDAANGKEVLRTNNGGDDVLAVTFSGDSKALIQSGKNGVLEVWDVASGKRLKQLMQSPVAHVLATSPDGRWLATLEHHTNAIDKLLEKDVIHLWDLRDGKKVREFTQRGWFMRIFFTPDSKRLLASNCSRYGDGYSSLGWDLSSGKEINNPVPDLLFARAFHPDGNRFVHGRGKFDQWDLALGKRIAFEYSEYGYTRAVCFNRSADRVLTLHNGLLTTWETKSGKRLRRMEGPGYWSMDPPPTFSADGKLALTYEGIGNDPYDIAMLVWDVARGSKTRLSMRKLPNAFGNAHQLIVPLFTPDRNYLVALQPGEKGEATIRIWNLKTGQETKGIPGIKAGWSRQMSLLADGKTLVIAGSRAVGIDLSSGKEIFAWKGPVKVRNDWLGEVPDDDRRGALPRFRQMARRPPIFCSLATVEKRLPTALFCVTAKRAGSDDA
jgi:RNA polymerase sigma factor (sigma-70 family)